MRRRSEVGASRVPQTGRCGHRRRALPRSRLGPEHRRARRRCRGRLCRRELRARASTGRFAHRRHPGRAEPDVHRLPVQQCRDRRSERAARAAIHLRSRRGRRHRHLANDRDRRGPSGALGHARGRRAPPLRSGGAGAGHRDPLERAAGVRPGGGRADASRMAGGRADPAPAPQLEAMDDGGLVVISAPANPFRCPLGPYERASLVAHFLKTKKPKSKLIVLDAKDAFSKQRLFQQAWSELYPGLLEWVPLSKGGSVTSVDAATRTLVTDFGRHQAKVANVIPPQKAGRIADAAGVADRSGWCPIDPVTFESKLQPGIHVIGDAAIAGAMPKSAFAANSQAKTCAAAVALLLTGATPSTPKLINTCYSLVAPDYGISVAGVYQPSGGQIAEVPGSGGVSPADAPRATRAAEAVLAEAWFRTITDEVFG